MDKQPFDHIENRIRQAADHLSPPFNEEAWKKMEAMLDGDKKKRRGFIRWWYLLFIGIVAGGAFLYVLAPSSDSDAVSGRNHNQKAPILAPAPAIKERTEAQPPQNNALDGTTVTSPILSNGQPGLAPGKISRVVKGRGSATRKAGAQRRSDSPQDLALEPPRSREKKLSAAPESDMEAREENANTPAAAGSVDPPGDKTAKTDIPGLVKQPATFSNGQAQPPSPAMAEMQDSAKVERIDTAQADQPIKGDSAKQIVKLPKLSAGKIENRRGFYILATAGADAVSLRSLTLHTYQPVYGASIGYRFTRRLSVQAGFYFGKRIYTAGPDDYSVKAGSYTAKIISADADCLIYDLPLNIRYDFLQTRRANFFASTGLSSFILKRETYDMHFFNQGGMYRRMAYTYTSNKNFFSIYNLSLGYEHKLGRTLSVLAEPYIKLPLTGVGEGKVKLYSAGLQAGIKYQPFGAKKIK